MPETAPPVTSASIPGKDIWIVTNRAGNSVTMTASYKGHMPIVRDNLAYHTYEEPTSACYGDRCGFFLIFISLLIGLPGGIVVLSQGDNMGEGVALTTTSLVVCILSCLLYGWSNIQIEEYKQRGLSAITEKAKDQAAQRINALSNLRVRADINIAVREDERDDNSREREKEPLIPQENRF